MDQTTVSVVNQLTLAAAAIIACGFLWRAYTKAIEQHIADLREYNQNNLYDLRARVMVLEDKAGIERDEKFKYMPPSNHAEQQAANNL